MSRENRELSLTALTNLQKERLAYLELKAFFVGELRRADLETAPCGAPKHRNTRGADLGGIYRAMFRHTRETDAVATRRNGRYESGRNDRTGKKSGGKSPGRL